MNRYIFFAAIIGIYQSQIGFHGARSIDPSSLIFQRGARAAEQRSLLTVNEQRRQARNKAGKICLEQISTVSKAHWLREAKCAAGLQRINQNAKGIEAMQCSLAHADNYQDYLNYAKEQPQKIAAIIAPHLQEMKALQQKNISVSQSGTIENAAQTAQQTSAKQALDAISILGQASASSPHPYMHTPVFIFVSFAMPKTSLQQWLWQAHKINAAVVVRGLVNNSFKDTAQRIASLIENHKAGLAIDPTLFQKFGITKVPAVAITDSVNCAEQPTSCMKNFDVVYGDVPLDYALDELGKSTSEFSKIAQLQLKILQEAS